MDPPLRFVLCGSVDDGKSTLIGRILHDCGQVFRDQMEGVAEDSRRYGTQGDATDLALLMDGLQDEREQGITIDVAYRGFEDGPRRFIVADAPGHEQYTRNMATGASTARLARRSDRCHAGGSCPRPPATLELRRCSGCATSSWRSTRWTWSGGIMHAFESIVSAYRVLAGEIGISRVGCHSRMRTHRRQPDSAFRPHTMVRRLDAARAP